MTAVIIAIMCLGVRKHLPFRSVSSDLFSSLAFSEVVFSRGENVRSLWSLLELKQGCSYKMQT